jgi:glycosyltransferase involved in cell wall biosynthesis
MSKHLTIIVPTKDRPIDMKSLFDSIRIQDRMPDEVIVVDGSDEPIEQVLKEFTDINYKYITVRPPSLPKQRNAGIKSLSQEAQWVGFLDDDIVLEKDCLIKLESFIETQEKNNTIGIGLSILNQPETKTHLYNSFFLMGKESKGGEVTLSGYPSAIPIPKNNMKVDWLYGGATFWRKDVFENFLYDEWFQGTGYMEDVDFSYSVSKKYDLMVCESSRCYHYHHGISKQKEVGIGEWQLTSWWYFIRKYRDFSIALVLWSMVGLSIKNLLLATITFSSNRALRFIGNIRGLFTILTGRALNKKGFSK